MITHKTYTIDSNFDNATEAAFPVGHFDNIPREGDVLEVRYGRKTIRKRLLCDAFKDNRSEGMIRLKPHIDAQIQKNVPHSKQIQRMVFLGLEPYYDNNLEKWFDFK